MSDRLLSRVAKSTTDIVKSTLDGVQNKLGVESKTLDVHFGHETEVSIPPWFLSEFAMISYFSKTSQRVPLSSRAVQLVDSKL